MNFVFLMSLVCRMYMPMRCLVIKLMCICSGTKKNTSVHLAPRTQHPYPIPSDCDHCNDVDGAWAGPNYIQDLSSWEQQLYSVLRMYRSRGDPPGGGGLNDYVGGLDVYAGY